MPYLVTKFFYLFLYYQRLQTLQVNGQKDFWTIDVRISLIDFTKILYFYDPLSMSFNILHASTCFVSAITASAACSASGV